MLNAQATGNSTTVDDLFARFGPASFELQPCGDGTPTLWLAPDLLLQVLAHLKQRFPMLLY